MLYKIKSSFDRTIDILAIIILVVLTYVTFYQVVARYVFSSPPAWTEESARYLFIWVTFLGSAIAFRTSAHLGVDFFVDLLPQKLKKLIAIVVNIALILILGVILVKGIDVVIDARVQLSPAMRIPMLYPYLAIPFGVALMILEAFWNLFAKNQLDKEVG